MFYDLNIPYSPDDPEILHTLNFLAERKFILRRQHTIRASLPLAT